MSQSQLANCNYFTNNEKLIEEKIAISPIENAIMRIKRLSTDSQIRQNHYIRGSLSIHEINSQDFVFTALNYSSNIGFQLYETLQESSSAPWKTYEFTPTGKRQTDINGSLYNGAAGIAIFFAYLDAIQPNQKFREAALRSLHYTIEKRDENHSLIGAFQGKAGLIYVLTHLFALWKEPRLLELAIKLTAEIETRISQDIYYDVLQGAAGVIPVMLGLTKLLGEKSNIAINCALACAEHLVKTATKQNGTLSWSCNPPGTTTANLTGFSHGAGGIGWALIKLGCHINEPKYISFGRQAFAYEAIKFDTEEKNWYDFRKSVMTKESPGPKFAHYWCSGSAGIGLSRIDSWATLGCTDEDILNDAYAALQATLRNFHQLENDSLCHGKSGSAELLLRFSLLKDEPYLQMEANALAMAQWNNFERTGHWTCGGAGGTVFPDLMIGLAGIGMHFLRLAYPDKVPSPLLLDPPLLA